MRLDYIDPFIESSRYVLSKISHLEIKDGHPSLKQSPMPTKENAAVVGIAGDMEGRVIFEMDDKTALEFAGIMNNAKYVQLSPVVIDSISELANIVIGNAVSRLNDKGFNFSVTPPTFFKGKELTSWTTEIETLVIPLSTCYGEIILNIAIKYNSAALRFTIDMLLKRLEEARRML